MGRSHPSGSGSDPVEFVSTERVKYVLEGLAKSRSDPEQTYQPRLLLQVDALCTCPSNIMRDRFCPHLQGLLDTLSEEDLRDWILDAVVPRD